MKSTKSFKLSDTIFEGLPFAYLLSSTNRGRLCDGCFKELKLTPCHGCLTFKYCSEHCRSRDFHFHKHECSLISKQPSKLDKISDDALYLHRLYQYSRSDEGRNASDEIFGRTRKFSDLMSNVENIVKDTKRCQFLTRLSAQIRMFMEDSSALLDSKDLLSTFGKMVTNSFSICDDDINVVGSGIYLGPSILDHSCNPNCVILFSGTKLQLKPNRDIKENEELAISYVEQMNLTKIRQEELSSGYYFKCSCEHCTDADRDMKMIGMKSGEEDYQDIIEAECLEMEEEAQYLKIRGDAQQIYELSKKFYSKWSSKLQPHSVYVYKCLDLYFDACIDLKTWERVLNVGSKMVKIHSAYIPNPHPKRVVDTLKYVKILLLLGKNKKALEYYNQVDDETKALFGDESPLSEEARDLKSQCLRDRRFW